MEVSVLAMLVEERQSRDELGRPVVRRLDSQCLSLEEMHGLLSNSPISREAKSTVHS